MVSFNMLPKQPQGLIGHAIADLSRTKKNSKERKILAQCDHALAGKIDEKFTVDFLDSKQPEKKQIRLRIIYELIPPFA